MKKPYIILIIILSIGTIFNTSCKKGFLDAKPSSSILKIETLDDYQSLLENQDINGSPSLSTLSADEYEYLSVDTWKSAPTATERNSYIWAKDLYTGEITGGNWSVPYQTIFYANNVLAGLEGIVKTEKNTSQMNFVKGWALFTRAFAYFELVSNFSPAYDANTATNDLGVPIKLNPSVDNLEPRSTVQQTYDQIFSDLKLAEPLLSENLPVLNRNQPSKITVQALLARIYLYMRKYELAEVAAEKVLTSYSKLIDYNTVDVYSESPFSKTNDELILNRFTNFSYAATNTVINDLITISSEVIQLYDSNDLRKEAYFIAQPNGAYIVKHQYNGSSGVYPFSGLATDEVYLIKAECAARRNDLSTAMAVLNQLLINRYKLNTFIPVTATNGTDALKKILLERRKELIWRNMRWFDIIRLNKEGANITLTRSINGQTYTLPSNDPRYVFPIPDNEIQQSGIQQNNR